MDSQPVKLRPELRFDPVNHEYWVNDRIVPNVTRIISWMNNYAHVPPDVLERARELGQAVHLATALDDNCDLDMESVDPVVLPYLMAWRQFRQDKGFTCRLIEYKVCSSYGYAGTLDRVGTMYGETFPVLVDIKATSAILPANGPQTAAYKQCLVDHGYDKAKLLVRATVQLCPEKTIPYRIQTHREVSDLSVFLSSLTMHNWKLRNGYNAEG